MAGRVGDACLTCGRNPQATALVHDPNDVQHWVSISGPVELVREGDEPSIEDAETNRTTLRRRPRWVQRPTPGQL